MIPLPRGMVYCEPKRGVVSAGVTGMETVWTKMQLRASGALPLFGGRLRNVPSILGNAPEAKRAVSR